MLDTLTPEQVCALCEVTSHLAKRKFPLQKHEETILNGHSKHLLSLVDDSVPYKEKKKILVQHGAGFVDELLKPVLTALAYAVL